MDLVHLVLRYLHLLGFAAVFGGWLVSWLSRKFDFNTAMLYGIAVQLATGIVLAGLASVEPDANHAKIGVKSVLALLLAVMIAVPVWKKRDRVAAGHFWATGALIAVTAGVAVFW
ncbi:hypothetical protein [Glycomyces terrestris]|uniref:Fe-S protein n=1 Tax=Glycomyces terrestris TaxID=2493553 RepID=A0A426UXJ9_9ACTN|nr:hypothetical protein [Glycomyces terrestris]RRR99297.1 hypothetical protein EIW28_11255 [Glycomyces terrestris]